MYVRLQTGDDGEHFKTRASRLHSISLEAGGGQTKVPTIIFHVEGCVNLAWLQVISMTCVNH